ncbi:hypothetical protein BC332_03496 [Capsicum chinense]|nr:hypothetical protein BC332_03496 [Capsicum chinense]
MKPINSRERKNHPFEGFNISDEAPKKLTKLINDYSEWIADGLLKHHAGRYFQQQSEFSQNEKCLIKTIKGFSIPAGLPWYLVDEVYIPINCGDEFHWVLAIVVLKEKRIRVYDLMSQRRHPGPSSEIQKLAKILPTYLDVSGFLYQKVRTDWLAIEAYQDKMDDLFDVQYVEGISQQTIGRLAYAPHVGSEGKEKMQFWEALEEVVRDVPSSKKIVVAGDFNGHIGALPGGFGDVHGGFGFGERNEEGATLLEFARAFGLKYWGEVIRRDMEQLQLTEDMTLDRKVWKMRITAED